MASQGPNTPTAVTQVGGTGASNWTNPTNVEVNDNVDSTNSLVQFSGTPSTALLICSGFGFNVPSGSTITGVQLAIKKHATNNGNVVDHVVQLSLNAPAISGIDGGGNVIGANGN